MKSVKNPCNLWLVFQRFSHALDRLNNSLQTFLCVSWIAIVKRLTKVSQRLRCITCVKTRRVDPVLVPGATTQAFRIDKLPFRLDQRVIDFGKLRTVRTPNRILPVLLHSFRFFRKVLERCCHGLVVQRTGEIPQTRELQRLAEELSNLAGIICVIKRQTIGVRQTHRECAPYLGSRDVITKAGIAEVVHPVKRIVSGMVNTVIAIEAHIC